MVSSFGSAWKAWQIGFALRKRGTFLKSACLTRPARRTEATGKAIERGREGKAASFKVHALAIDASPDATHTAQLTVVIRGTEDKSNVTEEMAPLGLLKDTTKSRFTSSSKNHVKTIFFVHCEHICYSYRWCPAMEVKIGTCEMNRRRCNCHPKPTSDKVSLQST